MTAPSDHELLRSVCRSLDWAELMERHPELEREDVAALFARLKDLLGPERAAPPAAPEIPVERVLLYCDGGSRGNPGLAGYGAVLTGPGGRVIAELAESIGHATNNEAEYQGLIAGLEEALRCGARDILARTDSELMARQIRGEYKVKNERLRPLAERAHALLARFESWRIEHIPREQNSRADALANQAMDRARS